MEICYFDTLDSTHLFCEQKIREGSLRPPIAVVANRQQAGVGTGENRWESLEGNLFLSFVVGKDALPSDLPLASASIYYAYLMKMTLQEFGSEVWIKWPNDLYLREKKVGGVITKLIADRHLLCSIGLNLKKAPEKFQKIDIEIEIDKLLEAYFLKVKELLLWKKIFSHYKIEFDQSRGCNFFDKQRGARCSLASAILNDDGSITVEKRKVYSFR